MRRKGRRVVTILLAFVTLGVSISPRVALASENCAVASPISVGGQVRLALLIGVGNYLDPDISRLDGPVNDVNRVRDLLVTGYAFPRENICVVTDERATIIGVEDAFQKMLDRVVTKDDVVVIYFAGHGSQTDDLSGDESDGRDETIVLHDSRMGGHGDFLDDDLNRWLAKFSGKSSHVTLILDSCNSGSAARGRSAFKKRWIRPMAGSSVKVSDGDATDWTPTSSSGLTILSAATDGTAAMEENGVGLFTQALVDILSGSPRQTYAQVAKRLPPLLSAAGTPQVPSVQGDIESLVFQNFARKAPISWTIRSLSHGDRFGPQQIELTGPPLPGIGPNAELRIYEGAIDGQELFDPRKAKGLAVVRSFSGFNATATVVQQQGAPPVIEGDIAVLVRPSNKYRALTISFMPEREAGGIPADTAAILRKAILSNGELKGLVSLTDGGELEASLDRDNALVLRGPTNEIRNMIPSGPPDRQAEQLTEILRSHARQRVLLRLKGEGGSDFIDQETLKVQIVPEARQTSCAGATWSQAPPNTEQIVPECYETHIRVQVDPQSPYPLLVGGLVLSSDGSIIGFPSNGRVELVSPGSTYEFRDRDERLIATSPYEVQDQILVFGTQEKNPVRWSDLTLTNRGAPADSVGTLHRTLDRYLSGARGQITAAQGDDTTWTMTSVPIRVRQRAGSSLAGPEACKPQTCEATVGEPLTGAGGRLDHDRK